MGTSMGTTGGRTRDWTLLALRIVIGLIFVLHGIPKLTGIEGTVGFFSSLGLPGLLGPAVGVAEVIAGPLVAVGLFHRAAVLVLAVIITGALVLVQIPHGTAEGLGGITAGLERDLLILVSLAALTAHGPGARSLDAARARPRGPDPEPAPAG